MSIRLSFLYVVAGCSSTPRIDILVDRPAPGVGTNDAGTTSSVLACEQATGEAEQILAAHCSSCHGPGGPGYAGFDDVADPVGMIADGWVIPGNPDGSPIVQQIVQGEMPPTGPLVAGEVSSVREWIACGADSWLVDDEPGSGPEPGRDDETEDTDDDDTGDDDDDDHDTGDEDEDEHEDEDEDDHR